MHKLWHCCASLQSSVDISTSLHLLLVQEEQQKMHGPAGTSITLAALSCRADNWEEMAIKLQVQIKNCT